MKHRYLILLAFMFAFTAMSLSAVAQEGKMVLEINKRLDNGDCENAQKLYDVYKKHYKTDQSIEKRINECFGKQNPTNNNDSESCTVPVQRTIEFGDGLSFKMIYVEGGMFSMGCTSEQGDDCWDREKPIHSVTLSGYYIGETEVTQAMWMKVMGSNNNPSRFKGDNLPVENVSWDDCQEFIRKLNGMTGEKFRLPTEAEWEYAARGGKKSRGYKYAGSDNIDNVAWYYVNSGSKTHQVKTRQPNELGLYDMSGNVWEWCQDRYGDYISGTQSNPKGPSIGQDRVLRGASWDYSALNCRLSDRAYYDAADRCNCIGFRLVLPQ